MFLITDCGFGLEGARAVGEAMKGKTKLTSLYLWGEQSIIPCFFLACITYFFLVQETILEMKEQERFVI